MPIYEFEAKDGTRYEESFAAGSCPTNLVRKRKRYRRVFSSQIHGDVVNRVHGYPYESFALEPGWPGCEKGPRGGQIVKTRQHEREISSASGDTGPKYERS